MSNIKKIICSILVIAATSVMYKFFTIGLVPVKYIVIIALLIISIVLLIIFPMKKNKKVIKIISITGAIIISTLIFTSFLYLNRTYNFIYNMAGNNTEVSLYYLVHLENNIEEKLEVGAYETKINNIDDAINLLDEKYQIEKYDDLNNLINLLETNKIDLMLIDQYNYDILVENIELKFIVYDTIKVVTNNTDTSDTDIQNESFNIYLSGIDTHGDIMTKSRSDVNMVITVNPKTNEIHLTNIPRDYYVELATSKEMDKLTHAGVIGINESLMTIENLLDINIDYYVRINFNSIVDFVDALGGINVYSEVPIYTNALSIDKGYNYMYGYEALLYSRERKYFATGDIQRGINQQAVINAIINKLSDGKTLATNYDEILSALENTMQTNMSEDNIIDFINYQLDQMPKWKTTDYTLTGTGDYNTFYIADGYAYVMNPDYETVNTAKSKIKQIYN